MYTKHQDKYCCICDSRIWWWQKTVRLYSLGMNIAHLNCAADYLRSELEAYRQTLLSTGEKYREELAARISAKTPKR